MAAVFKRARSLFESAGDEITHKYKKLKTHVTNNATALAPRIGQIPRALTANLREAIVDPAFKGTASLSSVQPELIPAAVALGAADLTLDKLDSLFGTIGLPARKRIDEGEFVKKSKAGKWTEQFLFGDIRPHQLPPSVRNKVEEDLKKDFAKKAMNEYLTEKGIGGVIKF